MGAVERAARVHGHQLGLRLVPGHHVRRHQSDWSAGGRGHGPHQVQGGHRLWHPLLRGHPPDHCIQYPLGPSVPLQKSRSHRSPALGPGRVTSRRKVPVRRSSKPGRKQAQDVFAARRKNFAGFHVPDSA